MKVHVQVELKDKDGKLIKRSRKKLSRSYIRQMIDLLYSIGATGDTAMKDTSGVARTYSYTYSCSHGQVMVLAAAAANDLYGIQVGTGEDAVTISDFQLKTKILHGDTSTKLNHGATSIGAVAIVGSTAKFTIARTFTNNSGADIDVKEVGLVGICIYGTISNMYIMLERTLLPFTIANGTSGTVTYTISVAV